MIDLALSLATAGTPVFPCRPENKRPYTSNGFKSASVFRHVIQRWWQDWPDALVGVPTGERTGVWVLDMDAHKGARESDLLHDLPPTRTVRTRSGGRHFYFHHAGLGNSPGRLPAAWDVRGQGGFVLVPGNPGYTLERDMAPADAPEWLLALIRPRPYVPRPGQPYQPQTHDAYVAGAVSQELDLLSRCPAGSRGYQLNTSAFRLGTLVGAGALDRSEAEAGLWDAAHGCGLAAVDGERACRNAIRRGLDAGSKQPRTLPERDNTPLVDVTKLLRKRRA
ncbi:putative DNA primase/helicase [Bradyrhizobium japonicum USDA 38]|uniref:bifunctional DNA primase/polymerase n=1 Tax=Bradyrhizobium japonicum TaxID=375 RepID=UPI0004880787|nr:bifunctional DNA primase/polymerase [Bradyrhizobium japonicum]MCS3895573.1 putative DNA primase/helicase [Bradyrhizobium japonicum USDA 38]MCS3948088.1 putative DNA primase/helicase [Bradyrhizobium japonicum]